LKAVFPTVSPAIVSIRGGPLAKPNYQFEKRQRDLAKKNKKEEKQRQKLAGSVINNLEEDVTASPSEGSTSTPSAGTPPRT